MSTYKVKKICCIGAGYVGGPTMTVFANNCPDIVFTVVDINSSKIDAWNNPDLSNLPVFEPDLDRLLKNCRGKNLFFSTEIEKSIAEADMVFLSVNTPTKENGIGAGKASDLKFIEESARQISKYAKNHTIIVEKSTVPVKTAQTIQKIINSYTELDPNINKSFSVLSNPEFLSEGTAINDLQNPDRVLIGGLDSNAIESLADIYLQWIPKEKIIRTNIWSSELSKLTANAFLAQRVSSINSISAICERTGADIRQVSNAIGMDKRIGSKFLNTGPGFGGSCFQKDIANLIYLCEYYNLEQVARYWQSVLDINDWQKIRIVNLIVNKLFGNLSSKKIAILGFAFKANTNDTRNSPAIEICKGLLEEGAKLNIYDPKVKSEEISLCLDLEKNIDFKKSIGSWKCFESISAAVNGCDAILVLTEWDEFKIINWEKISRSMRKPSWVFDSRLCIDKKEVIKTGLNYWGIGRNSD